MKIIHALNYYGDYLGGVQIYVKELAKRQKNAGHNVKIITSDLYGKQKEIDGIPIIRAKTLFSAFRVPFTPLLPFYLLKEKCDVLNVHLPLPWLDVCVVLKKILHKKTKLIITVHNYVPTNSKFSKIFAWFHNRILIRIALKNADIIITTTKEFANSLPYKIPNKKKKIIPYAVDINKFYPANSYTKNQILFVGRTIPEKGLHILMKAMNSVRKKIKGVKLITICSETYNFKNYEKKIRRLDSGFLKMKKNVPNNLLRKYYANSAVFVMPSLDIDSFGIVLLEAMACGCPVICSDLPGPSSIVNKNCGIVVPKGDAKKLGGTIIYMLRNSKKVRNKARKYVENNFSWNKVYNQIEEVYER